MVVCWFYFELFPRKHIEGIMFATWHETMKQWWMVLKKRVHSGWYESARVCSLPMFCPYKPLACCLCPLMADLTPSDCYLFDPLKTTVAPMFQLIMRSNIGSALKQSNFSMVPSYDWYIFRKHVLGKKWVLENVQLLCYDDASTGSFCQNNCFWELRSSYVNE
jgi:hypothetical protein